jgi:hypothetical protein
MRSFADKKRQECLTSIPVFDKIVLFGFGDVTFQKAAQERTAFFIGRIGLFARRCFGFIKLEAGIRTMSVAGLPGGFASRHTLYVPFKRIVASLFNITRKSWIDA